MSATEVSGVPVQLAIQWRQDAHGVVLALRGEVDLATAPQVEQAIVDAVSQGFSQIVVDLAGVEFVDSVGLSMLIRAQRHAESNRGSLILRDLRPQTRRLLEVSGALGAFVVS